MTRKNKADEPQEDAVEELGEEPMILTEPRAAEVPVDPATGKPYKSGEIPPGWNEPAP